MEVTPEMLDKVDKLVKHKALTISTRWWPTKWFSQLAIQYSQQQKFYNLQYTRKLFSLELSTRGTTLSRLDNVEIRRTWRDWFMLLETKTLTIIADDEDIKEIRFHGIPSRDADIWYAFLTPFCGKNYSRVNFQ